MPRFRWTLPLLPLLAIAWVAGAVHAEKPNMQPEALREAATHVVVGEIETIYDRVSDEGPWRYTRYVAQVRPESVEKGEGISTDAPLYVRYWTRRWIARGPMPAGTTGHRGLPKEDERLRIYLAQNAYDGFHRAADNDDGGFNVIGANGFERLAEASEEGR